MEIPQDWHPGRLLAVSGAYWQGATLQAAVRLNLFGALAAGAATAEALAAERDLDADGLVRLLDALCAMGLLEKVGGSRYGNRPPADRFLVPGATGYLGHIICHHHGLMDSWIRLEEAVRGGGPVRGRPGAADPRDRENFLMGMTDLARMVAPGVVERLDLGTCRRLLDLGGGPGTWALCFCRRHPQLRATVADLPSTRPFAEKVIGESGMQERVRFDDLDYHSDPIRGRYDAVWLSHILHAEGADDCLHILRKAVGALNPGGKVLVHEFILKDQRDGPLFPALFSLNMLLGTDAGRSYTESQLREMLGAAGVGEIHRVPVETPNDSGVLVGTVAG